jgi:predicted nucleotidyltransferase component of viral defense system
MLRISDQELKLEAKIRGYRPEILEKVYRLLDLLEQFMAVPYLSERLALKGGTAINLFCSASFPRLSVDLDFNYIGNIERDLLRKEREELEAIIFDICRRRQYELHRNPSAHAGGKSVLIYQSVMGNKGRLEIDLNYIFRVPLWDVVWQSSPEWPHSTKVRVLDIHELAVGKLHALLGREASRDLFDSYKLFTDWTLDTKKLRLAFVIYAGMEKRDWQEVEINNIRYSIKDIRDQLIPVLKNSEAPSYSFKEIEQWANILFDGCKNGLGLVLPFKEHEIEFLTRLQQYKEIKPELISDDDEFCERILKHPLLNWRAKQPKE